MKEIVLKLTDKEFIELRKMRKDYALNISWPKYILVCVRYKFKEMKGGNNKG